MMIRSIILLVNLFSIATAFVITPVNSFRTSNVMKMTLNDDITKAELEAIEMTKKFGAKSKEAIIAWETYEEIAASDNSASTKPSLEEACDTENLAECSEYEKDVAELEELIKAGKTVSVEALLEQNKKLVEENNRLKRTISSYK